MQCRSCGSDKIIPILNLGKTPWCNDFLTGENIGKEQFYPLELVYCEECTLSQLNYTVPKETMFTNHTYVSGTTKTLARHFFELAESNINTFGLKPNDLIVDIGGNDGTQLIQYRLLGMTNLVNVESAANIAAISSSNNIKTVNTFFNEEAVYNNFDWGSAKLINAAGVFFHLEELHSVLRGIKRLLARDGVFVVQFMYLKDIVNNLAFDAIYHEHLCYYTLRSLAKLLSPYGLKIFDAFHSPIHAGSMMARICHESETMEGFHCIDAMLEVEGCGLTDLQEFARKVEEKRTDLYQVLDQLYDARLRVYGYGAPAKSTTLLNYLGINSQLVEKMVEINNLKVGRYTPGTHIPIVKENKQDLPDYYLMLAYNFKDEILEKNRGSNVTFITPFPDIILHRTKP